MIIVSQDKELIVNFENVNALRVTQTGKIVTYENTYKAEDDCSNVLGAYKTKERAKEVLQGIIKTYTTEAIVKYNGYISFEMPKE